jgi:hypothetical protein
LIESPGIRELEASVCCRKVGRWLLTFPTITAIIALTPSIALTLSIASIALI